MAEYKMYVEFEGGVLKEMIGFIQSGTKNIKYFSEWCKEWPPENEKNYEWIYANMKRDMNPLYFFIDKMLLEYNPVAFRDFWFEEVED